jgi:ABC-type multidrug transport system fused ATPase/permease subunit
MSGKATELEALINHLLPVALVDDAPLLTNAWQQFANFDTAASQRAGGFRKMRRIILWVGVVAVTFAVLSSMATPAVLAAFFDGFMPDGQLGAWVRVTDGVLHVIALTIPIVSSILLAGANRFYPGEDWVALRGAAEDLKKEIFRYRTRTTIYSEQDRTDKLAAAVKQIGNRVMHDSVKKQEFQPYQGPIPPTQVLAEGDDGVNPLTGEAYLNYRLKDQLAYYENRITRLYREIRMWQWTIYASGGIGTLLGLLNLDALIAISTSVATGLASYMEMIQAEATLRGYNETAQILRGIQAEWLSSNTRNLSQLQREEAFTELVTDTEHALITERSGWISEMNQFRLQQKQSQMAATDSAPPQV